MEQYEKMMIHLMEGFDEHLESEKKIILLEECGRKCIQDRRVELIQDAKKAYQESNDMNDFLKRLSVIYPSLHVSDDEVAFIWEDCGCPIIGKIPPGEISPTICYCSRGWVKELLKAATGKSVEVIIDEAITKGDPHCKLRVVF
ncbi:MAG: hypothetical protein FK734_09010 [Asgard group archaeon]|nr:hypothetical protein [Asgard group archaeon]